MADQLTLPENTFYILEATGDQRELSIHVEMKTAVTMIHSYIGKDVPADKITLTEVTVEPAKLSAQQIPWSTIAVELIKAVKK